MPASKLTSPEYAGGPVTDLAARLAGLAEPGEIGVGPETVRHLHQRYYLQQLGREHPKHIDVPVEVYRLLGAVA